MKSTIGFEKEDAKNLHEYWDEIIENQQWSEGKFTGIFEEKWSVYNQLHSVAFSRWESKTSFEDLVEIMVDADIKGVQTCNEFAV